MQYRDITVEDLSEGGGIVAPRAFEVTGRGPHTVEFRSVDAAGNVEEKGSLPFAIGDPAPAQPLIPALKPIPSALVQLPATFRLGSVTARVSRATFNRRGVSVPVVCTGAMDGSAKLTVSSADRKRLRLKRATIDSESVKCWGPHTARVTLKPSSTTAKALARKGGPKRVKLTLTVQMRGLGKAPQTSKRTITLRR
jgi:hypothetical protein